MGQTQAGRSGVLPATLVVCYSTGMSIRCGHCKGRHERPADVRACAAGQAPRTDTPSDAANRVAAGLVQALQEDVAPLAPGFYESGPKVYRLAEDGSWALLSASGHWMTGARAPYRPARMTVEQVAAKGRAVIRCIVCGIALKKKESREAGIGPVCATKV